MKIDMAALRKDMEEQLRSGSEGFEAAVEEYGNADLYDPDSLLGLARAVGVDLSKYAAGADATDTFDTDNDPSADLGDLNDDVDDVSGDYY